jgi:hypothetical protein
MDGGIKAFIDNLTLICFTTLTGRESSLGLEKASLVLEHGRDLETGLDSILDHRSGPFSRNKSINHQRFLDKTQIHNLNAGKDAPLQSAKRPPDIKYIQEEADISRIAQPCGCGRQEVPAVTCNSLSE